MIHQRHAGRGRGEPPHQRRLGRVGVQDLKPVPADEPGHARGRRRSNFVRIGTSHSGASCDWRIAAKTSGFTQAKPAW